MVHYESGEWRRDYTGASAEIFPVGCGWSVQVTFATGQKIAFVETGDLHTARQRADSMVGTRPAGPWRRER